MRVLTVAGKEKGRTGETEIVLDKSVGEMTKA